MVPAEHGSDGLVELGEVGLVDVAGINPNIVVAVPHYLTETCDFLVAGLVLDPCAWCWALKILKADIIFGRFSNMRQNCITQFQRVSIGKGLKFPGFGVQEVHGLAVGPDIAATLPQSMFR